MLVWLAPSLWTLLKHVHVEQPQALVVKQMLGLQVEAVEVVSQEQAMRPCAAAGDADPSALAALHIGRDMIQTFAFLIKQSLSLVAEVAPV